MSAREKELVEELMRFTRMLDAARDDIEGLNAEVARLRHEVDDVQALVDDPETAAIAAHAALRGSGLTPDWPWHSLTTAEQTDIYERVRRAL